MLHLDRKSQAYLDALDTAFKATPRISTGLEEEISKVFDYVEDSWDKQYSRIQRGIRSWETKLLRAISDPLPAKYVGRPRPMQRFFPYSDSGELEESWTGWAISKEWDEANNSMSIKIDAGFTSLHADLTNKAVNSSRPVHWLHWVDYVLGSGYAGDTVTSRRSRVPDIRSVLLGYYS